MNNTLTMSDLLAGYRAELLERVVPFWLRHALDQEYGGLFTCIADDGTVLAEDKYLWSQLRAIWTFAALHNRIEARDDWLAVARHTFDFVRQHGRDDQGRWVFAVTRQGELIKGATSIFADGFAIYGLIEYAKATGDARAVELALETYHNVQERLARPGSYATDPYPLPDGVKAHSVSMIFSLVFNELGHFLGDQAIVDSSLFHAREVMDVYLRPERRLLYEFVHLDNTLIETPQGRAVVPGHAIESMWFMIHIFQREQADDRISQAIEAIRWHLEAGWDDEYGGLLLGRDAEGQTPWWPYADTKLWWPHTEALYACLLAYSISGDAWCWDWLTRVHRYAFEHFPVPAHGEWTQKLDRQGRPISEVVALPVKDPFHLPRALIHSIQVLETMPPEV